MIAYKAGAKVMAVFKDVNEKYGIYVKDKPDGFFKEYNSRYPHKDTRAEAEEDMAEVARKSKQKWKLIEFPERSTE